MTSRRGFLASAAGAIAALFALPKFLRAEPELPYEQWNLGLIDQIQSHSVHTIGDGGYEARPLTITELEAELNRALLPQGMALYLTKEEDRNSLLGKVHDMRGPGRDRFFRVSLRTQALYSDAHKSMVLRQIRYQTHMASKALIEIRRSGYETVFVDRPGHPLAGRIYYRHIVTGRIRSRLPA